VTGLRRCLLALRLRGGLSEGEIVRDLVRAVDAQLESLSEDHAKVVQRRRRWLADALRHPGADPDVEQRARESLNTEVVWEEMRRYRVYLTAWREVTAKLA
jgi:hypothetical protein